ncbi:MAG: ParB/RepB/Spo0J family partition protein [Clostridia bacterium]|nr:ParB/RepB/Spo0J family partition protein [Clostridia bacterium]
MTDEPKKRPRIVTGDELSDITEKGAPNSVQQMPIETIAEFPDHPFKVFEDEEMERIKESIRTYGVLTPAIARKKGEGYELISGHRRLAACRALGMKTLPVIVRDMTDDEAVIFMVDANLQREHIRPSEKAFAYKMKMEALSHQGKTCGQVGHKSRETVTHEESGRQVQRFIRLTNLIPELMQMVDDKKIAFNPAVELSYLTTAQQAALLALMQQLDCTPSHPQAIQFKKLAQEGKLDDRTMSKVLSSEKPNQKEHIRLQTERINRFFPKGYTPKQMEDTMIKLLSQWQRKRERSRDEPRR